MMLNIDSLQNKEKSYLDFNLSETLEKLDVFGVDYRLASPIRLQGRVSRTGRSYLMKARASFVCITNCARCLTDVDLPVEYDIEAYLMRGSYDEDDYEDSDVFDIGTGEVDLISIIESTVGLNMPQRTLCSEDCKGICSGCGVDLNTTDCKCEDSIDVDDIDPRFAKLKELLK